MKRGWILAARADCSWVRSMERDFRWFICCARDGETRAGAALIDWMNLCCWLINRSIEWLIGSMGEKKTTIGREYGIWKIFHTILIIVRWFCRNIEIRVFPWSIDGCPWGSIETNRESWRIKLIRHVHFYVQNFQSRLCSALYFIKILFTFLSPSKPLSIHSYRRAFIIVPNFEYFNANFKKNIIRVNFWRLNLIKMYPAFKKNQCYTIKRGPIWITAELSCITSLIISLIHWWINVENGKEDAHGLNRMEYWKT